MTDQHHIADVQLGGHPTAPDRYRIAEGLTDADRGFVVRSWTDSHHRARENFRLRIGEFKRRHRPQLERLLAMPGTRALVAHHDTARWSVDGEDRGPAVLGWIVWTTGRGWPAVHYAYTRDALDGVDWRRRGVMSELVDAAELGQRVVYTHRGEHARGSLKARAFHPRPLDEEIAAWMRRRAMSVAFVPLAEWLA